MKSALLFLNGQPPQKYLPELAHYDYIACTDGAYHNYLQQLNIVPHFLIGDLDSIGTAPVNQSIQVIHTPDQNHTDFEKALMQLQQRQVSRVDIYGANGLASDHFLGNLSVALQYQPQLQLTFYDDYGYYFFAQSGCQLSGVKDKIISILPFGQAEAVTLSGFVYPLKQDDLKLGGLISVRNQAAADTVQINFASGHLLVFVSR